MTHAGNNDSQAEQTRIGVVSSDWCAALKRARQRLYRMELRARKRRGNNTTYTEGKSEGASIGLSFAIHEIDRILRSANNPVAHAEK